MLTKKLIEEALEKHWNIKPAAVELGVGYSTLRKYIKLYEIKHCSRGKKDGPVFDRSAYFKAKSKETSAKITKFRRNRKIQSLEYLGGMKCMRCGFDEPIPDCYAFHHRTATEKDPNWSRMKVNHTKWEEVKVELDKCDVLCHNCHSIVHYLERK